MVEEFYNHVLDDDQLVGSFDGMDMNELRTHQVQFVSSVAGGPVEYSGDEMYEAPSPLTSVKTISNW